MLIPHMAAAVRLLTVMCHMQVSAVSRHGTNALYAMKEMNKKQIVAEDMVSSIVRHSSYAARLRLSYDLPACRW